MTPGQRERQERNEQIVTWAQNGMVLPEIARRVNLTKRYILMLCRARGVIPLRRGRPRKYPLVGVGDTFGDYMVIGTLSNTCNERVKWMCRACGAEGVGYTFNLRRNPRCHLGRHQHGQEEKR